MNDLIDRNTLLDDLRLLAKYQPEHKASTILGVCVTIKARPAVDAEPVRHGYWIPQDNTRTKFMCSDCKSRNHDGSGKYCSNCGAKMDAEVSE